MDDKSLIEALYREMYQAMVAKDTATLNRVHTDDFVLVHMTGMRQSKQEYIQAIAEGTLNYYSVEHEQMDIGIDGNHATLMGGPCRGDHCPAAIRDPLPGSKYHPNVTFRMVLFLK